MNYTWIATPIVGAIIGYTTNWIAIKMLFRPYTEKKILGIKLPFTPGLIPKERNRIALSLGQVIEQYLITDELILNELTSDHISNMILSYIDEELKLNNQKFTISSFFENEIEKEQSCILITDLIYKRFLDLMSSQVLNKIAKNETMDELFGEELIIQIKNLVKFNQPKIKTAILQLMETEEFEQPVKEILSEIISNKFGALGAMFANTNSIYDTMVATIREKVETIEISDFINQYLTKILQMELIEIVPENAMDNIINQLIERLLNDSNVETIVGEIEKKKSSIYDSIYKMIWEGINSSLTISDKVSEIIKNKILHIYHIIVKRYVTKLIASTKLSKIVEKQINSFEIEMFEEVILSIVKKELNAITWLGGFLGFIMSIILLIIK